MKTQWGDEPMDNQSNQGMTELVAAVQRRPHFNKLQFNVRLEFCRENAIGAKVYVDSWGQYTIKIEDCHTKFDLAPWVNYQGDCYMGRDGATYQIVDNPDVVDGPRGTNCRIHVTRKGHCPN